MFLNFLSQLKFLGGVYLGWGVGANDTAVIFGPAVATNAVRYRTAVILAAVFMLLGAVLEGPGLMDKVSQLAGEKFISSEHYRGLDLAFAASVSAAITITVLIYLAVPSSTSQASIGSIMGIGMALSGFEGAPWNEFFKMFIVWAANPVITAFVSFMLFKLLASPVNYLIRSNFWYNRIFRALLLISGSYGAYALGASHAAVTTAPFYKTGFFGNPQTYKAALLASLAGGVGMVVGVITYSRRVMDTVGKRITVLGPFSAFICVTGAAMTVHGCKLIGVPVSTSQAIVGSVVGVGFVKGVKTVNFKSLRYIFIGWIMTPVAGAFFCYSLIKLML